jgi:hypothetical protein
MWCFLIKKWIGEMMINPRFWNGPSLIDINMMIFFIIKTSENGIMRI